MEIEAADILGDHQEGTENGAVTAAAQQGGNDELSCPSDIEESQLVIVD